MSEAPAAIFKIPTKNPQAALDRPPAPPQRHAKTGAHPACLKLIVGGAESAAGRVSGEVVTLDCGIKVYPARADTGRWRAVWYEDGRRQQCEARSEEKLTAKLEQVKIRLEADAPKMRQPGSALIAHYLNADRLPVDKQWSRKHAHTQMRLCQRFAVSERMTGLAIRRPASSGHSDSQSRVIQG